MRKSDELLNMFEQENDLDEYSNVTSKRPSLSVLSKIALSLLTLLYCFHNSFQCLTLFSLNLFVPCCSQGVYTLLEETDNKHVNK